MSSAPTVEQFKRKIAGTELLSNFFGELEALEFPEALVREHYPEACQRWQLLGGTQSTPWTWVMFAELCLASFLSPTAVLRPIQSIQVYAVLWFFFVHPGSTSTSNLLRVYADALDAIECRARADRKERSSNWRQQHGKGSAKGGQAGTGTNPFAGDLSITMSAGSLEGEGRSMSCPQNLGRSVGFLAEGKRFLRWLQAEGTMNESIATELYERSKWKRTTIVEAGVRLFVEGVLEFLNLLVLAALGSCWSLFKCQDRSFEIAYPYFAACGALHVPDVASLFLEGDPLGLRGRMSFFYSRPAFKKAAEVRAANATLNSSGQLSEEVATFFWPCNTTHDPLWAGLERFAQVKGYPFRVYELSEAARAVFDQAFDFHVAKQKENHLVDQELAKFHGKAKTKHVRLALALHLYEQTRQRKTSETWSMVVEQKHLVVAMKLGEYLDKVSEGMARFYASVMSDPIPPVPSAGKLSARQQLTAVLEGDWSFFAQIDDGLKVLFWKLCHEVLLLESVWIENVALTRLRTVKLLLSPLADQGATVLPRVANLLEHLGLAAIVKGNNSHGTPLFFVVKRVLAGGMPGYSLLVDILSHFDISLASYKTFPSESVESHKPAKAAAMPSFSHVNEEVLRSRRDVVSAWKSIVARLAAAPNAAAVAAAPAAKAPALHPAPRAIN